MGFWTKYHDRNEVRKGIAEFRTELKGEVDPEELRRLLKSCEEYYDKVDKKRNWDMYAEAKLMQGQALNRLTEMGAEDRSCVGDALECLREALGLYEANSRHHQVALARFEMGNAYSLLSTFENHEENVRKTIKSYELALRDLTYDDDPELYEHIDERLKDIWKHF